MAAMRMDTKNLVAKLRVAAFSILLGALASPGLSFAQSFGGLSNLLGGGSSGQKHTHSSAVTVDRADQPFIGKFSGTQQTAATTTLSAQFACYPAHDSALPQNQAYLCYVAAGGSPSGEAPAGSSMAPAPESNGAPPVPAGEAPPPVPAGESPNNSNME